ncbi:T9SS type A sorting domain-containing protein [candidate division KSB1 bacterium]|nr:T9SS type A sorting domain-containing protein [candidate division KSB1 bacterium]
MKQMVKALVVFSLVLFVTGAVFATIVDDVLQIPFTDEAPDIDGVLDGSWYPITATQMLLFNTDAAIPTTWYNTFAEYRVMYDDDNLYLFVQVYDDDVYLPTGDPWGKDNIELFIDGGNEKNPQSVGYDANDTQQRWVMREVPNGGGSSTGTPNCDFAFTETDSTWALEVAIPAEDLATWFDLEEGAFIGWDIQFSDKDSTDEAGATSTGLKWWNATNNGWNDPSSFGDAEFTGRVTTSVLDVQMVEDGITVDGILDDEWEGVPDISIATLNDGDGFDQMVDRNSDLYTTYRLAWDEDALYLFVHVMDQDVYLPAGDPWNEDNVEIFIDGGNEKNPQSVGYDANDIQWRWVMRQVPNGGSASTGPEHCDFKFVEDPGVSWDLEVAIPASDLTFDLEEGTLIGWDIQVSDKDSTEAGVNSNGIKWWSSNVFGWNDPSIFGEAELIGSSGTGVKALKNTEMAKDYTLEQNYPNPFNPTTNIQYVISEKGLVKLAVYNVLGKEVASLVNKVQDRGNYVADFNASELSSGIYFYRLQAGDQVITRKMTLLK